MAGGVRGFFVTVRTVNQLVSPVERVRCGVVLELVDSEGRLLVAVVAGTILKLIPVRLSDCVAGGACVTFDDKLAGTDRIYVARTTRCSHVGSDQLK